MRDSIMYHDKDSCYLCYRHVPLEKHHVWHGTANRRLADKDGLYVWLCPECHRALHDKGIGDKLLMMQAQIEWMHHYNFGNPQDDFRKRYGRDLL